MLPPTRVTTGVTTRIYDDAAVERFNVSVGQSTTISRSRTGDDNIKWNDDKPVRWFGRGDTYWRISERWGCVAELQYDTRLDSVATSSSSSLEYRRDQDRLVQLDATRYAGQRNIFRLRCLRIIPRQAV